MKHIINKSFNPFENFSDEEMAALSSMGKKLREPSYDPDNLSDEEKAAFNKLTDILVDERNKFEDELIREYLDELYSEGDAKRCPK